MVNKSITGPKGFLAVGESCGIKKSGKKDVGLIVCPGKAVAAAVFTTNKITAAPVQISKKHIKSAKIEAVVVNSGNANACTGKKGINNAIAMCRQVANELETDPHKVLVCSTGIIGEQLPMDKVEAGIDKAFGKLKANSAAGVGFAKAIMTTDTKHKQAVREIMISGKKVVIAGCVKGAGMIGPNMATTLCFITTDLNIKKSLLQKVLAGAIGNSLNKLTVDGHQSTNDTAIMLGSGMAGNRVIDKMCPRFKKFAKAVGELCEGLAKQMASDAEGAKRIFKVVVKGAKNKDEAAKAARAVADYDLVKCAVNGADPNWGRIICAVGSCGVNVNIEKLSCKIGGVSVFRNGGPVKFDVKKVSRVIASAEHIIEVNLGAGKAEDFCWGCELSKEYVSINADYHT